MDTGSTEYYGSIVMRKRRGTKRTHIISGAFTLERAQSAICWSYTEKAKHVIEFHGAAPNGEPLFCSLLPIIK